MTVRPEEVHGVLAETILVEGYPLVFDVGASRGQYLRDARSQRDYLDFFCFYASRSLAFDHPALREAEYEHRVLRAGLTKPSNGDVYTSTFAEFVEVFRAEVMPPDFVHAFFIDGGALAVENALKVAFDWKAKKNRAKGQPVGPQKVIHFRHAFHGRSGYTLSLTNTDPSKVRDFPMFDWPRLDAPEADAPADEVTQAIDKVAEVIASEGAAAISAIIIEPVQCEGGDRHVSVDFLRGLRRLADANDCLLIFDEVQTGMGTSGRWWWHERAGVQPDVVAFAKRAQTGGVMATTRIDDVENVFREKSRISSTFSGNLVDFVRCQRIVEVVRDEGLLANATRQGDVLLAGLRDLAEKYSVVERARGMGLILAFDLPDGATRDRLVERAFDERLLVLPCGPRSLRLRPALDVDDAATSDGLERLERALRRTVDG